ncbi:hypothetical protein ADEAN_000437500 [Angomonas deanei]|uniref:Uncharacterized protein n=1 Tax=Angomonas deanei TaxID=59799 RepID=A0A7G2CD78_9TRYP|nr:hypothetical protein ADEAN_000437500 [Angomonas deanei]
MRWCVCSGPGPRLPSDRWSRSSRSVVPLTTRETTPDPATAHISGSTITSNKVHGLSVHGMYSGLSSDLLHTLQEEKVLPWVMETLKGCGVLESFASVAKLCLLFFAGTLRVCITDSEVEQVLQGEVLALLEKEILSWPDTFIEMSTILLSAVTPRGWKKFRPHSSTQAILSLLLERLEVVGKSVERQSNLNNSNNNNTSRSCHTPPPPLPYCNPYTAIAILRDLSDAFILPENIYLFLKMPNRLEKVFNIGRLLPPMCVESLVMLLEKMCKRGPEMGTLLQLLLTESPTSTTTSASDRSTTNINNQSKEETEEDEGGFIVTLETNPNNNVESDGEKKLSLLKAEIICMLFDVARSNTSLCELIIHSHKNQGIAYLLMLVHGLHHSSEVVRVYAMRLLALLLVVNKNAESEFIRGHGVELLSLALTTSHQEGTHDGGVVLVSPNNNDDPLTSTSSRPRRASSREIPVQLFTFDVLFGMSCAFYRPADGSVPPDSSSNTNAMTNTGAKVSASSGAVHHNPSFTHNTRDGAANSLASSPIKYKSAAGAATIPTENPDDMNNEDNNNNNNNNFNSASSRVNTNLLSPLTTDGTEVFTDGQPSLLKSVSEDTRTADTNTNNNNNNNNVASQHQKSASRQSSPDVDITGSLTEPAAASVTNNSISPVKKVLSNTSSFVMPPPFDNNNHTKKPVVIISVYKDVVMDCGLLRQPASVITAVEGQGSYPGMVQGLSKLETRREYSFEGTHDFAKVDERLRILMHSQGEEAYYIRHPAMLQVVFKLLQYLVLLAVRRGHSNINSMPSSSSAVQMDGEGWR